MCTLYVLIVDHEINVAVPLGAHAGGMAGRGGRTLSPAQLIVARMAHARPTRGNVSAV